MLNALYDAPTCSPVGDVSADSQSIKRHGRTSGRRKPARRGVEGEGTPGLSAEAPPTSVARARRLLPFQRLKRPIRARKLPLMMMVVTMTTMMTMTMMIRPLARSPRRGAARRWRHCRSSGIGLLTRTTGRRHPCWTVGGAAKTVRASIGATLLQQQGCLYGDDGVSAASRRRTNNNDLVTLNRQPRKL